MNGRVDPTTTLRKQYAPFVRGNRMGDGVGGELHLESWEVFHHERREVTVFSEREQVLLVQGVDIWLRVFVYNPAGDDDRSALIGCSDSVDTETTGEAGD